jgi:hypothetical protein
LLALPFRVGGWRHCDAPGQSLVSLHFRIMWSPLRNIFLIIQGPSWVSPCVSNVVFWIFIMSRAASPAVLSMWPCKSISHIQVLLFAFFQPHP